MRLRGRMEDVMAKVVPIQELEPKVVEEALDAGEDLTITRDDKPIGRIVRVPRTPPGPLAGSVTILGDIVEPLGIKWEADE